MIAGRLSDRITVQRPGVVGDDTYGNPLSGWTVWHECWANIRETPGREAVQANRLEAARTATIRIRKGPIASAITTADRVLARGRVWNIRGVALIDEGRELIEMTVEEDEV